MQRDKPEPLAGHPRYEKVRALYHKSRAQGEEEDEEEEQQGSKQRCVHMSRITRDLEPVAGQLRPPGAIQPGVCI